MTKREHEITNQNEIIDILNRCKIVHIGLSDGNEPYVLPMNYGYTFENGKLTLYLHGATKGHKYELIKKNSKVCFQMECDVTPFEGKIPCQYGVAYKSLMGKGTAEIIDDTDEKIKAMTIFMKTQTKKEFEFNEKLVSIVNLIKICVSEFSAKERPLPEGLK